MMRLFKHFIRATLPVTIVATGVAVVYCLFYKELLEWKLMAPFGFVIAHSAALAFMVGRPGCPGEAFVYSRGHSRDAIWITKVLVSFVSVFLVCGVIAAMTNLGPRAWVQERIFENPRAFFMWDFEGQFALYMLPGYIYLLAGMHYFWARREQSGRNMTEQRVMIPGIL